MDDFFDDDFLDFDNEDDFEEFNQSQSLISRFNLFVDSLSTKHYLAFGGVVLLLITGYFINYRFSAPQNEVAENEYLTSSTTVASTSSTTVKDQNITNTLDPLGSTVMVALPECGYMGSGTVISKLGFIMTNEHVIADDGTYCNDYIVILTSESGDKDPKPKYLAEIVESNVTLDIAILEITATFDGSPLQKSFRNRCIGDSDTISLGDELLIWGYPDVRWVNFDTPGRI